MKLKKFKKAMLTLLLIIMGCFLCACNKQSEKEQQKAVDDSQLPELKIGVNMLKPYFYMNENKWRLYRNRCGDSKKSM